MGGRRPPAMCDASRWEIQHRPAAHARRLFGTATAVVTQTSAPSQDVMLRISLPHWEHLDRRWFNLPAASSSPDSPSSRSCRRRRWSRRFRGATRFRRSATDSRHRRAAPASAPRHVRIDRAGSPRARFRIRDGRRPVAPPATVQAYSGHTKTDLARSATCGPTSSAASRHHVSRSPTNPDNVDE